MTRFLAASRSAGLGRGGGEGFTEGLAGRGQFGFYGASFIILVSTVALAIFGYQWIHQAQKVMTAVFAVVIVIALKPAGCAGQDIRAVDHVLHGDQPDSRGHPQCLHRHAGVRQPGSNSKSFMAAQRRQAVRLTAILPST
jgi:hypothetical protein